MGERIVVTGGAGRIGGYVVAELQDDYDVVVFDRVVPASRQRAEYRIGEHEDLGQVCTAAVGAAAILHLAATPTAWRAAMFTYVDVRDLARAFRAALEHPEVVCEAFNVAADDSLAEEPLSSLLPRLDPRLRELATGLTEHQPMASNANIKRLLGWQPRYSWRT